MFNFMLYNVMLYNVMLHVCYNVMLSKNLD